MHAHFSRAQSWRVNFQRAIFTHTRKINTIKNQEPFLLRISLIRVNYIS